MVSSSVRSITVVSSDGDEFEVTVRAAMQSELLKSRLEACSVVVGKVPLFTVNTPILVKVMEYCQKHADYEAVAAAAGGASKVADAAAELMAWDAEFVNEEMDMVLNILMAANYLDIKGLLDLSYQAMADMIKEKSLEQIQQIFVMKKNDFTVEQEQEQEQIRRQNQWAFNPIIILE